MIWTSRNLLVASFLGLIASCKCGNLAHEAQFVHGMNVPWVEFGRDVGNGNPPLDNLREQFAKLAHATRQGVAVARLWIHTDARFSPEFDEQGFIKGPQGSLPKDLKAILDVAGEEGVKVLPVLWSHDLLRSNEGETRAFLDRNRRLLTDEAVLQSYIDHALKPMVETVTGHPALYGWEIINEPEGMSTNEAWDIITPQDRLSLEQIQVFVAKQAAALRRFSLGPVFVTVGSVSAKYLDLYKDHELKYASKDSKAYLDFYQIHFYDHMPKELNPFLTPAISLKADKPILVGEFYPHQWPSFGLKVRRQMYDRLRDNGYMGALAWKDDHYPETGPIFEAIGYSQDLEGVDVKIKD